MPATTKTTLNAAIAEVERALATAESATSARPGSPDWFPQHKMAMELASVTLSDAVGARINERWDGCRVTIAGVTSTSTSGMAGALRNWIVAARRLSAAGAAAA